MNTIALRNYKATLHLTERQRELLVGMMLGDAHLEAQRQPKSARLKVEHSVAQFEYVTWKFLEWKDWVRTAPQVRVKTRLGTVSMNVSFATLSHVELNEYRTWFYEGRCKKVPKDLRLTPLGLAVWFMDDGSRKSSQCRGLYLNTQSFERDDVEILRLVLDRDFGIHTTVRAQSDGLQIYIPSGEVSRFVEIVEPHVTATMRYKLPR